MSQWYFIMLQLVSAIMGIGIAFFYTKYQKSLWHIAYCLSAMVLIRMTSGAIKMISLSIACQFQMSKVTAILENFNVKWFLLFILFYFISWFLVVFIWNSLQELSVKSFHIINLFLTIIMCISLFLSDWQVTVQITPLAISFLFVIMAYRSSRESYQERELYYHKELQQHAENTQKELDELKAEVEKYYAKAAKSDYEEYSSELLAAIERAKEE